MDLGYHNPNYPKPNPKNFHNPGGFFESESGALPGWMGWNVDPNDAQAAQRAQANGEDYQTSPRQTAKPGFSGGWLDKGEFSLITLTLKMVMVMGCCWKYVYIYNIYTYIC